MTVVLDERTGELVKSHAVEGLNNAAFIRHHPTKDLLYVATECIDEHGDVVTYKHERSTGALTAVGSESAHGASTCFISVTPDQKRAPPAACRPRHLRLHAAPRPNICTPFLTKQGVQTACLV